MTSATVASISQSFLGQVSDTLVANLPIVLGFVAVVIVLALILRRIVSWTRRVF